MKPSFHTHGSIVLMVILVLTALSLLTLAQWHSILVYQRLLAHWGQQVRMLPILEAVISLKWEEYRLHSQPSENTLIWQHQVIHYRLTEQGAFACMRRVIAGVSWSLKLIEIQAWLVKQPNQRLTLKFGAPMIVQPCATGQVRVVQGEQLSWQYG